MTGVDQNTIIAELQQVRERIIQEKAEGKDVAAAEETFKQAQPAFQSGDMASVAGIVQAVKNILDGGPPEGQSSKEETMSRAPRSRISLAVTVAPRVLAGSGA